MGKKHNAYLLSADQKRLVEITDEGGCVSSLMLGVTGDGLLFMVGKTGQELNIDGTKTGVPLVARTSTKCTSFEAIDTFNAFDTALNAGGGKLLQIEPANIFHLMHYDAILAGWWAYNSSLRFTKPESLPSLEEVSTDGQRFEFCRDEMLSNAYHNVIPMAPVDESKSNTQQPIATAGGEELYSARFFNSN